MTHWTFIVGAYAVTAILVALEILAVRARQRAARDIAGTERKP